MIPILLFLLIVGTTNSTVEELKERIKANPFDEQLHLLYAEKLYEEGHSDSALSVLNGLLGWAKDRLVIWQAVLLLSKLYLDKGNYSLSGSYLKGLLLEPELPEDIRDEARLTELVLKYRSGSTGLKSPIDINLRFVGLYPESRKSPQLLHEVFLIYLNRHEFKKAEELLTRLIIDYPSDTLSSLALREFYNRKGEVPIDLVVRFADSVASELDCEFLIWIAERVEEKGLSEKALDYLEIASKKDRCRRESILMMAEILSNLGRRNESLVLLEKISDPEDSLGLKAILERMTLLYYVGRTREEDSLFRTFEKELRGDALALLLLKHGELLLKSGEFDSARVYLDEALKVAKSEFLIEKIKSLGADE